jgi:hypothetical protein
VSPVRRALTARTWTVALARLEACKLLARMSAGEDPNAGKRAMSTPVAPPPSSGPTMRETLEIDVTNMRAGRNRRRRVCAPRSIQKMETEIPRYLPRWKDHPARRAHPDRAPESVQHLPGIHANRRTFIEAALHERLGMSPIAPPHPSRPLRRRSAGAAPARRVMT